MAYTDTNFKTKKELKEALQVFDLFLGEKDVCNFLNEMYPVEES